MLKPGEIIYDDKKREYKIIKLIAKGGMGLVLLVERVDDSKKFAVKTLSDFIENDIDHRALINEGKLAQGIKHKNVISYEYFHDGETYPGLPPFIIMEYAEESNLQNLINEHIESDTFFEQDELINLLLSLINGMEAINKVLVHRDIKPLNILIKNGELKISDFGIAKIAGDYTRSVSFKGFGTLSYLSPEVFLNKENSIKMDIYSMGIVFYLMATLKHPYEEVTDLNNENDWKNAHLFAVPMSASSLNRGLSVKIFNIIEKMIEKNPSKRYSSWGEIRDELKAIDKLKNAVHSNVIEKMMIKNLATKTKLKQVEIENAKKKEEENRKIEMIKYQFKNDILKPIEAFISEYNSVNIEEQEQIKLLPSHIPLIDDQQYKIIGANRSFTIEIKCHIIDKYDYSQSEQIDIFGDRYKEEITPILNRKIILAWGYVTDNSGKGFNIILTETTPNDYGEWFSLKNTHSGLSIRRDNRPEPFAFDLNELKKEIRLVNAMHIYNTEVNPLYDSQIIEFISSQ